MAQRNNKMADQSLGGGIGQGLMSFTDTYLKAKQMQQTNARDQQYADLASEKEQAGLLGQGMQTSPGGTVGYTPEMQQLRDNEKQQQLSAQQIAKEEADPTSERSQRGYSFRVNMANTLKPGIGDKMIPKNASEAELKQYDPIFEKTIPNYFAAKAKADATTGAAQIRSDSSADRIQAGAGAKASKEQNGEMQKTLALLEAARGSATSQAEKDLYASQKANTLFNKYKDPNSMTNQETQLYATEIAKMASGGVPSIHELQGLNPNTIPASLSAVAAKYSNDPQPANAGAFMKKYKEYSDGLAKDAQEIIQDKYGRIVESKKDAVGPGNYQKLQDNYINRFTKKNGQGLLGGSSTGTTQPHPMDSQAVQWAKANPKDPRSDAILKANGIQ